MKVLKYNNIQHVEVLRELLDTNKIYLHENKHNKFNLYYCNGKWASPKMDTLIGKVKIEEPY